MLSSSNRKTSPGQLAVLKHIQPLAGLPAPALAKRLQSKPENTKQLRQLVRATHQRGAAQYAHRILHAHAAECIGAMIDHTHTVFVRTAVAINRRSRQPSDEQTRNEIEVFNSILVKQTMRMLSTALDDAALQVAALAAGPLYEAAEPGFLSRLKKALG
jgi:hypothetical protein